MTRRAWIVDVCNRTLPPCMLPRRVFTLPLYAHLPRIDSIVSYCIHSHLIAGELTAVYSHWHQRRRLCLTYDHRGRCAYALVTDSTSKIVMLCFAGWSIHMIRDYRTKMLTSGSFCLNLPLHSVTKRVTYLKQSSQLANVFKLDSTGKKSGEVNM